MSIRIETDARAEGWFMGACYGSENNTTESIGKLLKEVAEYFEKYPKPIHLDALPMSPSPQVRTSQK